MILNKEQIPPFVIHSMNSVSKRLKQIAPLITDDQAAIFQGQHIRPYAMLVQKE